MLREMQQHPAVAEGEHRDGAAGFGRERFPVAGGGEFDPLADNQDPQAAARGKSPLRQTLFTERQDDDVRTYDFAYENGRWVLKTDLDKEQEKLIELVFNFVLDRQ